MSASAERLEVKNPKTDMTHAEMKEFIRNHFEEFVNRKTLRIGEVNFAPGFVDHGPAGTASGTGRRYTVRRRRSKKSSRHAREHRRPDRRRRQSSGAQPLDGDRCGIEAAAGIFWNRNLENRQPADRGALGLPGESTPRPRLGSGAYRERSQASPRIDEGRARANVVASVLHSPFASCASWTGISSAKFSATHFSDLSSLPLYFSCPSLCA